ncbi:NAD(P)-dependent oxidoreductase [Halobacillus halophilus]|uniref:Short-chain dehydrogenase/reductase family protein n=1 Tax=Halobacillus halophilus (strain ATCC 35676 / DSM 2266 / JCM 20832 / KCTC 3685 / LMG 17431 / NBRC 102448 / NCIMB 2269) TaxID=866895 RepID=I0JJU1_HALH3|nr:SDR family oxidoreductase [Halobacillus halophilus]ASF38562.1 NAD(P)-dependent oxidoreductase [Halobacillus halophilus]CCG44410.1 short-chain dehydrogenase/reductase family protein [Halobacillus halophilus DSM 2266]
MSTVFITGAGSGLGRALAHQYGAAGYRVIVTGRTEKKLLVVQSEIEEKGGQAEAIVCDVTEPASISEALRQVDDLDVLINNAGLGIFGELHTYTKQQMDDMWTTNVRGTMLVTQAAYPKLKEANGRVLNIISTAGLRGKKNESVYCASKFAVKGFTESLQKEWEEEPLTATSVFMGGMNTPFWEESTHVSNPDQLKGPEGVAEQIYNEDDGRKEIIIDQ